MDTFTDRSVPTMKVETDAKDWPEMLCHGCGISSYDTSGYIVAGHYACESCGVSEER